MKPDQALACAEYERVLLINLGIEVSRKVLMLEEEVDGWTFLLLLLLFSILGALSALRSC